MSRAEDLERVRGDAEQLREMIQGHLDDGELPDPAFADALATYEAVIERYTRGEVEDTPVAETITWGCPKCGQEWKEPRTAGTPGLCQACVMPLEEIEK